VYEAKTKPMIDYYAERERLLTVDGSLPPDEVTAAVMAGIDEHRDELGD
jgi:adenylate kinase family enzyme